MGIRHGVKRNVEELRHQEPVQIEAGGVASFVVGSKGQAGRNGGLWVDCDCQQPFKRLRRHGWSSPFKRKALMICY